jgi:plasmid stability protein
MATLTIRRLDDEVHARLRERARANKRSLEAEVRNILESQAGLVNNIVDDLLEFHAEMISKHGILPDSLPLIRAQRDAE